MKAWVYMVREHFEVMLKSKISTILTRKLTLRPGQMVGKSKPLHQWLG